MDVSSVGDDDDDDDVWNAVASECKARRIRRRDEGAVDLLMEVVRYRTAGRGEEARDIYTGRPAFNGSNGFIFNATSITTFLSLCSGHRAF
ncbi:hypothetical protein E4U55_004120 [Claviceps digitariae]|nr:hypothetical protein E4U55_004120 [Claviceps digitariae]